MLYKNQNLTFALILIVLSASCVGQNEKDKQEQSNVIKNKPVIEQAIDPSSHPGQPLYKKHCLPCHQANGEGIPGMFPPLVDTKWVNGENASLISIVLHGMDEKITVNGEVYSTIMAPLPYLKDQEVADVLNYVRLKFGAPKEQISAEEVKTVRNNVSSNNF